MGEFHIVKLKIVVYSLLINNIKYWWNAADMICRQEIILIMRDKTGDSIDRTLMTE